MDDANFIAANAVLTGLVTGGLRFLTGSGSFEQGFVDGAMGGGISFIGKRIAADGFPAAGLLGRQVSAIGVSIARNSREGRGAFEHLVVPVLGVRVSWNRRGSRWSIRPDLTALYWTAYGLAVDDWDLDVEESLRAGTVIFRSEKAIGGGVNGLVNGGVIFLSGASTSPLREVRSHELVHVLQLDQMWGLWAEPFEQLVTDRLPWGGQLFRHVDVGVASSLPASLASIAFRSGSNPFEVEADYLEARTHR